MHLTEDPRPAGERLREQAPKWITSVDSARQNRTLVMLTVDAFADDPERLLAALQYAHAQGVGVMLAPQDISA
jgi:hypothetical protein